MGWRRTTAFHLIMSTRRALYHSSCTFGPIDPRALTHTADDGGARPPPPPPVLLLLFATLRYLSLSLFYFVFR
jgi:hypothetical protein